MNRLERTLRIGGWNKNVDKTQMFPRMVNDAIRHCEKVAHDISNMDCQQSTLFFFLSISLEVWQKWFRNKFVFTLFYPRQLQFDGAYLAHQFYCSIFHIYYGKSTKSASLFPSLTCIWKPLHNLMKLVHLKLIEDVLCIYTDEDG